MLHDFLTEERDAILQRSKQKALEQQGKKATSAEMDEWWGQIYDELIEVMEADKPFAFHKEEGQHTVAAEQHGREYHRLGFTVSEVVHSYGIICQSITSLADELGFDITAREFQHLNLSLDTAIAEAVTEFERVRDDIDQDEVNRLGKLAQELRGCLVNVTITLEMIQSGSVGARSQTGRVMEKNLQRMTALVDGALTQVRMRTEPESHFERTNVFAIMHEVGVTAGYAARARNVSIEMRGDHELAITVDRQLLISALAHLVQNAIRYSKPNGMIRVRAHQVDERVLVEVEDEGGGLPANSIEELIKEEGRQSDGRTGIGRGLSISKLAIERNRGELRVENIPGKGFVFIIDLPAEPSEPAIPAPQEAVAE